MSKLKQAHWRQIHRQLAPVMFFPLLLTLITGSLFQIAALTGKGNDFFWLLEWHTGKFGVINLSAVYPFLNAFGLLMLAATGVSMWLQIRSRRAKSRSSGF